MNPTTLSDDKPSARWPHEMPPGTARELRNLIERSLIPGALNVSALYPGDAKAKTHRGELSADLHELQRRHILTVLDSAPAQRAGQRGCWGSHGTLERRCAEWAAA